MFSGLVLDSVFLIFFFFLNLNLFDSHLKLSKAVKLKYRATVVKKKMMIVKYLGFSSNNSTKLLLINYHFLEKGKEKWRKTQERRTTTKTKFNPLMTPSTGFEPRPH